ncbi:hypothetical protein DFH28DRAFT_915599 [Melampsora americana]|nr:hypothetical protein DFH28DRAFT_915599 [Melampsora americana]
MNSYLNHLQIKKGPVSKDLKVFNNQIPKIIHQTNQKKEFKPKPNQNQDILIWDPKSWKSLNSKWDYYLSEDEEENEWVHRILGWEESSSLLRSWNSLSNEPVMRADLWRYLKLLIIGGVYSDMDTKMFKTYRDLDEIEIKLKKDENQSDPSLSISAFNHHEEPSVIVGIEADVGDREDWEQWWPRPIQLVQWTIAAAPGHPILIDTLRRLVATLDLPPVSLSNSRLFTEKVAETEAERIMRVVKATGPAPFTDAVLRYLGVMSKGEVVWNSLRNVPPCGLRIGDVLVLPISAFSPGVKIMVSFHLISLYFQSIPFLIGFLKLGCLSVWIGKLIGC